MTDLARLGRLGLTALALAGLAAGLWTLGGPMSGQAEARDAARLADLERLADMALCTAAADGGTLPAMLVPDERCAVSIRMGDPVTDVPYAYEKTSDRTFRICATFERPETMSPNFTRERTFEPQTGCLTVTWLMP